MAYGRRFFYKLRNFLEPSRAERDLAREIGLHLELLQDDFRRRGMSAEEARLAAKRAYGGIEQAKELHRDERSWLWLEQVRQDIRFSARALLKTPGFSITAVLTLALGIGANTAIFSLIDSVMLKALPVSHPEQLLQVTISGKDFFTNPIWEQLRDSQDAFSSIFAYGNWHLKSSCGRRGALRARRIDRKHMKSIFFLLLLWAKVLQADGSAAGELLAKASILGDLKTLESLLSSGINPDLPDRYGHTPLYYAASFSQTKAVELLLAGHADPNTHVDSHSHRDTRPAPATPLQYAAELGNRRIASILIAAGARINERGPTGRTALHYANSRLDLIQLLIDQGADVNARDVEGASPLDEAVWYGFLDTVAVLLAHGARLNEIEPKTGATPINEAAYKGHARLVQYLLQFEPDLGIPDKNGYRALDNAIRMGKEDSAVLLLDAEAKETETPQFLTKAMDAAIRKDESVLIASILRHGGSANGILSSGSTPLDAAALMVQSRLWTSF